MILIADGGSTKTDWLLQTKSGQKMRMQTPGINPFFQSAEDIEQTISNLLLPQMAKVLWVGPITEVHFFGAGCTPEKSPILAHILKKFFKHAEVEVGSDMIGAAKALFGSEKGIACILGTGSNSCLWDGEKIIQNVPALGFILGDEGSGAVLGKTLVADILKNQLSKDLQEAFLARFQTSQAEIIERVYRQPFPNRFLASLSIFAAEHISDPQIEALVYNHFDRFAKRVLSQYPPLPIRMVGSVAYYYKDTLTRVMHDNNMELDRVMRCPLGE